MSYLKKIEVLTTYLSVDIPYNILNVKSLSGFTLLRHPLISVEYYMYLYARVGMLWGWTGRYLLSKSQLTEKLRENEIVILYKRSVPVGFYELEFTGNRFVEIAYFGVEPDLVGGGVGKFMMSDAFQRCNSLNISKIYLHTCSFDHPNALSFYQSCGFEIRKTAKTWEYYPSDFLEKFQ